MFHYYISYCKVLYSYDNKNKKKYFDEVKIILFE